MISNLQIKTQICIPTVKWYQSKDYVIMNFEIYNGTNSNIKIHEDQIEFQIYSNDLEYVMNFNFFENIDLEQSKYEIMDKCVKVVLKKTSDNSWTYLSNDKNIYKNNIKIDWNGWTDDSDDENNNSEQFDFQKMMENMKGMGGMENIFGNSNFQKEECGEEEDENFEEEDDEEEENENEEENNNLEE